MSYATIDLKDSLNDTPEFRYQLQTYELELSQLEAYFKNLTKLLKELNEASNIVSQKTDSLCQLFENTPNLLNKLSNGRTTNNSSSLADTMIKKTRSTLLEVNRSRQLLVSHINEILVLPIELSLKDNFSRLKENKRWFDKLSEEYDATMIKVMAKKESDPNLSESCSDLAKLKHQFRIVTFDYVSQLLDFQTDTNIEFVESLLGLMYSFQTFHHQSYENFKDTESHLASVTDELQKKRSIKCKEVDETDSMRQLLLQSSLNDSADLECKVSNFGTGLDLFSSKQAGYLLLKSDQRYLTTWTRYYFKVEDDHLFYYARDKGISPVGKIDLKLCAVKSGNSSTGSNVNDRKFCFLLQSNARTYYLQAENLEKVETWIRTLQSAIENALKFNRSELRANSNSTISLENLHLNEGSYLDRIRSRPGNDSCADCKADAPTWACINLGILVCIECSGVHRSLGVQISKVRSLTLDNWEDPLIEVMIALGNNKVNRITEYALVKSEDVEGLLTEAGVKRCIANSPTTDKARWIEAKYKLKKFIEPIDPLALPTNQLLSKAIQEGDLTQVLKHLLIGADVKYKLQDGTTSLHNAVQPGNLPLLELLALWTTDLQVEDTSNRTPLHFAALSEDPNLVWFLLQRGADPDAKDQQGKLPVDLATDSVHISVVMAFRYFSFLKNSNPRLLTQPNFGYQEVLQLFGADPSQLHQ